MSVLLPEILEGVLEYGPEAIEWLDGILEGIDPRMSTRTMLGIGQTMLPEAETVLGGLTGSTALGYAGKRAYDEWSGSSKRQRTDGWDDDYEHDPLLSQDEKVGDHSDMSNQFVTTQQDAKMSRVRKNYKQWKYDKWAQSVYDAVMSQQPSKLWYKRFKGVIDTNIAATPDPIISCGLDIGFGWNGDNVVTSGDYYNSIGYNNINDIYVGDNQMVSDRLWKEMYIDNMHADITLKAVSTGADLQVDIYIGYFTDDYFEQSGTYGANLHGYIEYLQANVQDAFSVAGWKKWQFTKDKTPFDIPRIGEKINIEKSARIYLKAGDSTNFMVKSQKIGLLDEAASWVPTGGAGLDQGNMVRAGQRFCLVMARPLLTDAAADQDGGLVYDISYHAKYKVNDNYVFEGTG